MENTNILIIDGDLKYCNYLQESLKGKGYNRAEVITDYNKIDEIIINKKPDIILMDVILPGADGLYIMKKIKKNISERNFVSNIIVLTAFYSEKYIKETSSMGIHSYLIKPINIDVLSDKIREVENKIENNFIFGGGNYSFNNRTYVNENNLFNMKYDPKSENEELKKEIRITKMLHDMGIPAHLCGHDYLRDAIIMVMESHEISGRMTKEIYPEIGKKYKKSPQSVERAIRTALDVAWTRGKTELINDIFRFTVNIQKGKPTNSEFISLIADHLRFDEKIV